MNYPRVFDDGSHLWTVDEDGRVMFACGRRDGGFEHMEAVCTLYELVDVIVELEELV